MNAHWSGWSHVTLSIEKWYHRLTRPWRPSCVECGTRTNVSLWCTGTQHLYVCPHCAYIWDYPQFGITVNQCT